MTMTTQKAVALGANHQCIACGSLVDVIARATDGGVLRLFRITGESGSRCCFKRHNLTSLTPSDKASDYGDSGHPHRLHGRPAPRVDPDQPK